MQLSYPKLTLVLLAVVTCVCGRATAQSSDFHWKNATIYFAMIDRFANGDPTNERAYGRTTSSPYESFLGGDLTGLTEKVSDGYFTDLGVNAIWVSPVFEQIHGWVGGFDGTAPAFAYHGYWPLDWTEVDSAFGTANDFEAFVDACHEAGIRVVMDVVINHAGYHSLADMREFDFGTMKDSTGPGVNWSPAEGGSWHDYHESVIDYETADAWRRWWGPDWIRAGIPGYDPCGAEAITECVGFLPDIKEVADGAIDVPPILQRKWSDEKLSREREELDGFFERTGLLRTPSNVVIKWVTDWVLRYGVDGFRVDAAKHIGPKVLDTLKNEAQGALESWRAANPDKTAGTDPFWIVAEVFGHGPTRSAYFDSGADAVINFSFADQIDSEPIDSLYSSYSELVAATDVNLVSYLSSHDTGLYARDSIRDAATKLMLAPGAVELYYGDETGREPYPVENAGIAARSPMNWETTAEDVFKWWKQLGQFRARHVAVGMGRHTVLSSEPYTFLRSYEHGMTKDNVVVVLGASGRTPVNVSRAFPDDSIVRDAVTGKIGIVSFGMVTFTPDESGTLLLELDGSGQ